MLTAVISNALTFCSQTIIQMHGSTLGQAVCEPNFEAPHQASWAQSDWHYMSAGGQTNPEHLRQIYQAHLMLQLRVQEVGDYNQPEAIMNAARAVCFLSCLLLMGPDTCFTAFFVYECTQTSS